MNRAVLWSCGIVTSLAIHASVIGVLPIWLAPEPIADEPRPQSEMRIETQEVARSESSAIPPPSENLAPDRATGTELDQGSIPESRASAEPVKSAPLAETAPPPPTAASAPQSAPLAETAPPVPTAPSAPQSAPVAESTTAAVPVLASAATSVPLTATTRPDSAPVAAAALPIETAVIAAPLTQTVTATSNLDAARIPVSATIPARPTIAAAAPETDSLPDQTQEAGLAVAQSTPDATPVPQGDFNADAVTVAQSAPDATAVPQGDFNADAITAALAWSGDAGSQIDAQAFATIQSFMQAGDISQQSTETRDALTDLLAQVPCSRLQAEFDPATGSIVLRGHIPEEGLRAPVLAALQTQLGQGLPVVDEMLILGRPQCSALTGIGAVGLPQSTDQNTDARLIGPNAQAAVFTYTGGQTLRFGMQAPDYDAYVYVDYFDAGGNVFHIVPSAGMPLALSPAKSELDFQAVGPNGEDIQIGPPYGQEIAVAFAASEPLFDEIRPLIEPAEPYLAWLREKVAAARAADPDFKGEWVYFFVATRGE